MNTAVLLHLLIASFWIAMLFYLASKMTMKGWQDLLDSLSTAGGNIVTLFLCSAGSGLLWWTVYNQHGADGQAVMATFGIFGGFTGALLQAQKGNSSKQQMADRVNPTGGEQVKEVITRTETAPSANTATAASAGDVKGGS